MKSMTIIEQIKTEIERRIKRNKEEYAPDGLFEVQDNLAKLLSFLSTLESGTTYDTQQYAPIPSVSIEDVARVQFASHAKVIDKKRKAIFDWEQFKEVAGIFYGFGKKDSSDTLESEKPMDQVERIGSYNIVPYIDDKIAKLQDMWREEKVSFDWDDLKDMIEDVARHFAQWGAEHLKK